MTTHFTGNPLFVLPSTVPFYRVLGPLMQLAETGLAALESDKVALQKVAPQAEIVDLIGKYQDTVATNKARNPALLHSYLASGPADLRTQGPKSQDGIKEMDGLHTHPTFRYLATYYAEFVMDIFVAAEEVSRSPEGRDMTDSATKRFCRQIKTDQPLYNALFSLSMDLGRMERSRLPQQNFPRTPSFTSLYNPSSWIVQEPQRATKSAAGPQP